VFERLPVANDEVELWTEQWTDPEHRMTHVDLEALGVRSDIVRVKPIPGYSQH
jgi:hypothetical protein